MHLSLASCCIENVPLLLKWFCFGLKKVTADYFQWFLHLVMLKKLVQDFAVFQWPHTSYVIMTIKWEHMVQQYLTVPEAFWAVISQHGFHTLLVIQTVFQCWISIQVLWQRDQLVCVAYFMRNVLFFFILLGLLLLELHKNTVKILRFDARFVIWFVHIFLFSCL